MPGLVSHSTCPPILSRSPAVPHRVPTSSGSSQMGERWVSWLFKLSIVIKFIVIKVAALVPERSNVHVLRL